MPGIIFLLYLQAINLPTAKRSCLVYLIFNMGGLNIEGIENKRAEGSKAPRVLLEFLLTRTVMSQCPAGFGLLAELLP